jgi:pimeloyl-ACP methyl ester carboxylesterase
MPVEQINGTPLAYESVGSGDPLVLVHGSWNQREGWMFLVPELSPPFRVVAYDRRGHGGSTLEPADGTFDDDVADLAALIEQLEIAPALPGAERAIIPGAGHVPHATHPREYAVLIRDFLSRG